jgi:hypothetical protein
MNVVMVMTGWENRGFGVKFWIKSGHFYDQKVVFVARLFIPGTSDYSIQGYSSDSWSFFSVSLVK